MSEILVGWSKLGFSSSPTLKAAPSTGLRVYRCWGGNSTEWGNPNGGGLFALEKPSSVLDAELRFKIVEWGNRILFVSTFELLPNVKYWSGQIFHHQNDVSRPATQILVEQPLREKMRLLFSKEVLRQDVHVLRPNTSQHH